MSIKQVKPKIITLQPPCVRNQRTLVWLQNQYQANWTKWDAVVTSLKSYYKWQAKANIVGIILTSVPSATFYEELYQISPQVPVILLTNAILATKSEEYWADNFDNIMNLDDLPYPYLAKWEQSIEDAVGLFTHLCRYNRLVDCNVSQERFASFEGNITLEYNIVPPAVWFITQYFRHSEQERANEITECLQRNVDCTDISKIVLLTENDYSKDYPKSTKIQQIVIKKRLTYAHFLQYVKERVPSNTIVVLANADIFLDSLSDLWSINMKNAMLALLRWDVTDEGSEIFGPRADSQDTWIVLSDSVKSVNWNYDPYNVQLGQPGCDNVFAGQMLQNRFVLYNPALTIKTYHLHKTQIRNYSLDDTIRALLYVNLVPGHIIHTKQIKDLEKHSTMSNELVVFEVKSTSISNAITYCTMLEKDGRYKWESGVENFYFDEIPVYKWTNACVTPTGLVYTPYTIYPGDDEKYPYWKDSSVTIFTPLQSTDVMIALPIPDMSVFTNKDTYLLYYYSRIVRFLKQYPTASYWSPNPSYTTKGSPILVSADTACYAKEVVGFVPQSLEVGKEDITVLRETVDWIERSQSKRCIVIGPANKKQINELLYKDWYIEYLDQATVESLIGASLCIFTGCCHNMWALPKGATIVEFQQELDIKGEMQHLAHICELQSWVILLSKGEEQIHQLSKWFVKNEDTIL